MGSEEGYRVDGQSVDSMQVDGEAVVLNLANHTYFGLNATGTEVWDLVKAHPGISSTDIASVVAIRHDRTPSEILTDIVHVLDVMVEHQLVATCPASAAPTPLARRRQSQYVAPRLDTYGALDTLILSGE